MGFCQRGPFQLTCRHNNSSCDASLPPAASPIGALSTSKGTDSVKGKLCRPARQALPCRANSLNFCQLQRKKALCCRQSSRLFASSRQQRSERYQPQRDSGDDGGSGESAISLPSIDGVRLKDAAGELQDTAKQVATAPSRWQRRWTIVTLCFVAFMLCNMDRVNMSIAVLPMSKEFGWSPGTVGIVQSSFFWGYLLTQILGGVWADKFGGKRVLGFGVVWWSLATAFTPIAAHLGLPFLLAARACMGIGEGVAMPSMNTLLSRWVPVQERSRSLAMVYSGMYTGSIMGLSLSPHMVQVLGWPSVFFIFGSLGVVWFALWQNKAESSPSKDERVSPQERAYIKGNTVEPRPVEAVPWGQLLSKAPVWALILSHFCHNWGTFILLTWMPSYYNQVLGMDLLKSGFYSVLPWITMAISANAAGLLADTLIQKGVSITRVRKAMQTIGFLGPAIFLTQLGRVHTATGAVLCMMASQGLDAFSQSGLYSNHQDIGPQYAGVLLGLSNTAGVLAGVLGTAATGIILQNGSWDNVWQVAIALYLVGAVIWNLFSTGERVFND